MAEEVKTEKETRKTVIVTQPENGAVSTILMEPGLDVIIRADTAEAFFSRKNDDLEFAFEDDGIIILKNYFTAIPEAALVVEQPDGILVTGDDFFEASSPALPTGP